MKHLGCRQCCVHDESNAYISVGIFTVYCFWASYNEWISELFQTYKTIIFAAE